MYFAVHVETEITESSVETVLGENFTLTCQTHIYTALGKPTLTNPLLRHHLMVKWVDIDGNPVAEQGSITLSELLSNFSLSINFIPLSEGQNRFYICETSIEFPQDKLESTSNANYQVVFGKGRWHLLSVCTSM